MKRIQNIWKTYNFIENFQMQDCGQPPPELAGDLGPMLNLDEHGNPQLPPNFNPNQCSLM